MHILIYTHINVIYVYIQYTHICTYTHTYPHTYIHICIHICIYMYIYIFVEETDENILSV